MLARLSARKYVSLSRDRRLGITAVSDSTDFLQSNHRASSRFTEELNLGLEKFKSDLSYVDDEGADPKNKHQHCSLFELDMPGVMTLEEVEAKVDLSTWKLKLGSLVLSLDVSNIPCCCAFTQDKGGPYLVSGRSFV